MALEYLWGLFFSSTVYDSAQCVSHHPLSLQMIPGMSSL